VGTGIARKRVDWRSAELIALDTSPILYLVEDSPTHAARVLPVFLSIERGERQAIASSLALLEILVAPYRARDEAHRPRLRGLLLSFPNLTWVDVDLATADRAAYLRARYALRTPDAIHLASALQFHADLFLTNDRRLRRVREIPVALVEELPTLPRSHP
jgi:predicted nucleic acid-binding protein